MSSKLSLTMSNEFNLVFIQLPTRKNTFGTDSISKQITLVNNFDLQTFTKINKQLTNILKSINFCYDTLIFSYFQMIYIFIYLFLKKKSFFFIWTKGVHKYGHKTVNFLSFFFCLVSKRSLFVSFVNWCRILQMRSYLNEMNLCL